MEVECGIGVVLTANDVCDTWFLCDSVMFCFLRILTSFFESRQEILLALKEILQYTLTLPGMLILLALRQYCTLYVIHVAPVKSSM